MQGEKVKLPIAPLELVELTVTVISKGLIRGPNLNGEGATAKPIDISMDILQQVLTRGDSELDLSTPNAQKSSACWG